MEICICCFFTKKNVSLISLIFSIFLILTSQKQGIFEKQFKALILFLVIPWTFPKIRSTYRIWPAIKLLMDHNTVLKAKMLSKSQKLFYNGPQDVLVVRQLLFVIYMVCHIKQIEKPCFRSDYKRPWVLQNENNITSGLIPNWMILLQRFDIMLQFVPVIWTLFTVVDFRLEPMSGNDHVAPALVPHVKSGQKWPENNHLTTFAKVHSESLKHSVEVSHKLVFFTLMLMLL